MGHKNNVSVSSLYLFLGFQLSFLWFVLTFTLQRKCERLIFILFYYIFQWNKLSSLGIFTYLFILKIPEITKNINQLFIIYIFFRLSLYLLVDIYLSFLNHLNMATLLDSLIKLFKDFSLTYWGCLLKYITEW